MSFDVYGIGNALVDIQAQVSDALLEKLGYAKGMMTLVDEPAQQAVLSELDGASIHRCAGGSAANTIIGLADFGGKAAYAGKVGNDALGDFCLEDMRKMGVSIEVPQAPGQTGTCVVLITDDAQRTMLTHLGVSAMLAPDDVDEAKIAKSKYIYIEGYLFTAAEPKAAAYRAIEFAQKHGVKVAFTVSDPFLIDAFRDEFWKLIEGPVDLLFCNIEEARSLTELDDAVECAQKMHQHVENVALTLGPDGSILMHENEVIPIEGVACDAIDTTGAGDMYAAGLLYGITNSGSWSRSGRLASLAASRIVAQLGARLKERLTPEQIAEVMA